MIEVKHATLQYTTFTRAQGVNGVIRDFFKRRKQQVTAVADVSFTIKEGEMVGLIGRNGAGKTTLVKLLTGILPLTQGTIVIDQAHPNERRPQFLKQIGVLLGQRSQLIWDLPPIDTYDMLAALYELRAEQYHARLNWLCEQLAATDLIYLPVRKLSLGQRVKCELIAVLLHEPKYLFLDEPTLGLDLVTQKAIYKILRAENQQNKTTIVTTSHYVKDMEQLADRLLILNQGALIFDDNCDQLVNNLVTRKLFDVEYLAKGQIVKMTWSAAELFSKVAELEPENILTIKQRGVSLEELISQLIEEAR
ncbi:ATP-binding cassette domain-containing protein [Ligilactobacillus animalis]|nr:ATP-binding cassette domain-containing protein [Ligilactobacillus animalis]